MCSHFHPSYGLSRLTLSSPSPILTRGQDAADDALGFVPVQQDTPLPPLVHASRFHLSPPQHAAPTWLATRRHRQAAAPPQHGTQDLRPNAIRAREPLLSLPQHPATANPPRRPNTARKTSTANPPPRRPNTARNATPPLTPTPPRHARNIPPSADSRHADPTWHAKTPPRRARPYRPATPLQRGTQGPSHHRPPRHPATRQLTATPRPRHRRPATSPQRGAQHPTDPPRLFNVARKAPAIPPTPTPPRHDAQHANSPPRQDPAFADPPRHPNAARNTPPTCHDPDPIRASILPPYTTSIDVERVFSQGRLLLSHVRSRLSVHSTRALLCVGTWSVLGLIKDSNVKGCLGLDEVCEEEEELAEDWDAIPTV
ncbi:hypothetical protein EDB84DRAFT_1570881 [Lactarius hengduanensis]|nr:hypothetical protein EDB84DRAFT_1570881 [Lactarius hengduanensis]